MSKVAFFEIQILNDSKFSYVYIDKTNKLIDTEWFYSFLGIKSSNLELVWGRKTSYKVDPQIKKRNGAIHYDHAMTM